MHNEAQIRALDVCIQKMQLGEKLDQVLDLYPQWKSELVQPLEAVQTLRVYSEALQNLTPAQSQDRNSFLETAQKIFPKPGLGSTLRTWVSRLGWLGLLLLASLGLFWGVASASAALPGDLLYPVKEFYRQARLIAVDHTVERLILERAYDQARLDEVQSLAALNAQANVRFAGLFQQPREGFWTVGGIPLQLPPEVQMVGKVQENIWASVSGELQTDGSVLVTQIRPREYSFRGVLEEISPQTLTISGVPVQLDNDTLVHGSPMAGSQVNVAAFRTSNDGLLARLVDATE